MANGRRNGNNGGRQLEDWLSAYDEFTSEQESPSLFHYWVGTSVISATLERRVFVNRGYYTLYPNLYIILIGASARVRKSTAIGIGYNVLTETFTDLPLISQKITVEAFASLMAKTYKEKGVSSSLIISDEFSVFLGKGPDSVKLMGLLTKCYDCPEIFDYHTIARGKEMGYKACCNLLAGTTPDGLINSMSGVAIGGGFTSRIIFVYQDKPEKLVPFPEMTPEMEELKKKLVHDLAIIGKLKGQYKLTDDARKWYIEWYTEVFKPETTPYAGLDGYFGRKHDTLLKVAMCMAASRSNNLVIDEIELKMALRAMNKNEHFLPETLRLIQMTDVGEEMEKVLKAIKRREEIDHVSLMRQVSYCMNAKRMDEIVADLVASDKVVEYVKNGKRWYKVK